MNEFFTGAKANYYLLVTIIAFIGVFVIPYIFMVMLMKAVNNIELLLSNIEKHLCGDKKNEKET